MKHSLRANNDNNNCITYYANAVYAQESVLATNLLFKQSAVSCTNLHDFDFKDTTCEQK